ncbi:MAG TPA: TolC family protein [Longimicrobiales bacterium]|nr:TolC family protein [Longimicrobiales bacterium]
MKHLLPALCVGFLALAAPAGAQQPLPSSLSLEEALEIARADNPSFRQTRNDADLANWNVRQAWGALFPQASANAGVQWQGAGEQQIGSLTLGDLGFGNQPSYYLSNYRIGLSYYLDWATIKGPSQARADRQATYAQIDLADASLTSQVTDTYVEALRQQEALRIAELQLENSEYNLRLAQAQLEVGAVTGIDVGQAEVQVGRSAVRVLQSRNALATARIRLLQQLGQRMGQDFTLTTTFELAEPTWTEPELEAIALRQNPTLEARRRSQESASIGVSSARSSYFPSMTISSGWSGFAREASNTDFQVAQAQAQIAGAISQCIATNEVYSRLNPPLPSIDCSRFTFTDAQRQAIINQNNQFPFGFVQSQPTVSLQLSVPIFSGFSRQRNLEAARLQREDLVEQVREQEIALEADIAIGVANVRTAYESALLEERNRALAEQQLNLARDRYQLGEINFVDLVDAQTVLAQAEADRLAAVYAYHDLVTVLEALVAAPLRN